MFWDVVVHPSNVAAYEEVVKKEVELYTKYEFPFPWSTSSTFDGHYYYGIPIDNYGMLEEVTKALDETQKKMGDEYTALEAEFEGLIDSMEIQVWTMSSDLSYQPEKPRLTAEEEKYFEWVFIYYKPDAGKKLEEILSKWKGVYKSQNVTDRYTTWVGDIGTEMPVHCYNFGARSAVDYHTRAAELEKTIGPETEKLWAELSKHVRKIDTKSGFTRPELSMISFSERQPTTAQ